MIKSRTFHADRKQFSILSHTPNANPIAKKWKSLTLIRGSLDKIHLERTKLGREKKF